MLKVAILLLVAFAAAAFAQSADAPGAYDPSLYVQSKCETYGDSPQSCTDFVNDVIWVPTNSSQTEIQNQLADYADIDNVIANIPSPSCKAKFLKLLCGSAFRKCYTSAVDTGVNNTFLNYTFGQPVCKSLCVDTIDSCREIFETAGYAQYLPNCSYEVSGYPVYPEATLDINVYGYNVSIQCYIPPGPDGLCVDAGVLTICAGSSISSPVQHLLYLLEETVVVALHSFFEPWLSMIEKLF